MSSQPSPYLPLKPKPLWTAAADQIRDLIESGEIPVGARLPSERDLCGQLGISRISLRESLRALQSTGYVETRPGSGTYARLPEPVSVGSLAAWIAKDIHILELFELRRAVEPGIAGMAAIRHKDAHLAALEAAVAEMADDSPRNHARVVAADAEFHRLIGHSIENPAISRLIDQIHDEGGVERRLSLSVPGQTERAAADHLAIYEAIARRDEAGARDAMSRHLDRAVEWIMTYSQQHPSKEET